MNARIGWKALTAREYQDDGYVFLSTSNIKSKEIDFEDVNYISEFRYEESPELKLAAGDVLLAKDGNTLGTCNIVRHVPRPSTVNGSIAVLRPCGIDPNFLFHVIASDPVQNYIDSMKDGMGVPHLFQRDIKKIPIPLPSLEVQRRVAEFLDSEVGAIDRLIGYRKKWEEKQWERWRSVLESTVEKKARGRIPLRRSLASMPQYGAQVTGVEGLKGWPRYIRITDITSEGRLRATGIQRISPDIAYPYMLKPNDILVARSGATVGKSFIFDSECEPSAFAGYLIRLRVDPRKILPRFLVLWMSTADYWMQISESGVQATIQNVSAERYKSLRVPLLSVEDQLILETRFLRSRDNMLKIHEVIDQEIVLLEERKRALITAAVTGQIDVTTARGADLS